MSRVQIRYRRPPDRLDIFVQELVVDRAECKITLHDPSTLTSALSVGSQVIYEPGAPIVWFVFPHRWYDLGRFHLRDATFTGYYVNLIRPPELAGQTWSMYDLCLDLWIDPADRFKILDQDEFEQAVDNGWIDRATAARARRELDRLIADLDAGRFPPPIVHQYDLELVRQLRSRMRLADEGDR